MQADTIQPNMANPQSLNRYAHVLNAPMRHTDPTGHKEVEHGQGETYVPPLPVEGEEEQDESYSTFAANMQSVGILVSWFFNLGDEELSYGPFDPLTLNLRDDIGVKEAQAYFKSLGCPDGAFYDYRIEKTGGAPGVIGHGLAFVRENVEWYMNYFSPATVAANLAGYQTPPENTALGNTLGSYRVKMFDVGNGQIVYHVRNNTDLRSLSYMVLPAWTRDQIPLGGQITEHFWWSGPSPCR